VLWGVVLVRLLVPVAIPINIDISNNVIGGIVEMVLPNSPAYSVAENTTPNPMTEFSGTPGMFEMPLISEVPSTTAGQAAETLQGVIHNTAPTTIIWLVGMIATFVFFAVIYFKNHRTLRFATLIKDNDFLNKWLAEHRHIRPITIMQSDRIESPFAVGIIKPRIILPKSMDMNDRQLLDYVLAHEYFHIKRFDALWKMFLLLALCVHWFNPMVWVMFVLASRDLELTCDEAVIHRFGATTKKAYAYMLIGMAEQKGKFAPLYSGFSKNATQERIVSIMKVKKTSIISMALSFALVAMLAFGTMSAFAASNDAGLEQQTGSPHSRDVTLTFSVQEAERAITTLRNSPFIQQDLRNRVLAVLEEALAESIREGRDYVEISLDELGVDDFTNARLITPDELGVSDFSNIRLITPGEMGVSDFSNHRIITPDELGVSDFSNIRFITPDELGVSDFSNMRFINPDDELDLSGFPTMSELLEDGVISQEDVDRALVIRQVDGAFQFQFGR
jgi:beta-lactamase regulating signal transducer with metallopeptidase domain